MLPRGVWTMRKRPTSTRMRRLVTQWRLSGETQAGFARRHHIPAWTFWYWCRKLSTDPPAPSASGDVFVPVRVAPEDTASVLEIMFAGGDRLHVRTGAPADLVQAVVTALRARC
jgi:hypothetical protein